MVVLQGSRQLMKRLYTASSSKVTLLDVPSMNFLMIDGEGDPKISSEAIGQGIASLYAVAYTVKFTLKRQDATLDFTMTPPEGLWWTDAGGFDFRTVAGWHWTLMIMMPEQVTADHVADAQRAAAKKRPQLSLTGLRFDAFAEGKAAQILHVGPYETETATIQRLDEYIRAQGLRPRGKHHEIYLGDPRRAAPEKLKTIIRHPVE